MGYEYFLKIYPFFRIAFKLMIGMETMCFNITSLFFGKYFLQFGGPIEQFGIRKKVSLVFMVGLTTPSPAV